MLTPMLSHPMKSTDRIISGTYFHAGALQTFSTQLSRKATVLFCKRLAQPCHPVRDPTRCAVLPEQARRCGHEVGEAVVQRCPFLRCQQLPFAQPSQPLLQRGEPVGREALQCAELALQRLQRVPQLLVFRAQLP
jgi:hypothetical protein